MVIGHLAPALLARTKYPGCSVVLLVAATYAADLIEVALPLVGFSPTSAGEYSHSVPLVTAVGVVLGFTAMLLGSGRQAALAVAVVAVSHIPLDWVTGEAKPLVYAGGPTLGLDLYRHPALDWLVEGGLCVAAWAWWTRNHPVQRRGWTAAALVFLLVFQAALTSYTASHPIMSLFERAFAAASATTRL